MLPGVAPRFGALEKCENVFISGVCKVHGREPSQVLFIVYSPLTLRLPQPRSRAYQGGTVGCHGSDKAVRLRVFCYRGRVVRLDGEDPSRVPPG